MTGLLPFQKYEKNGKIPTVIYSIYVFKLLKINTKQCVNFSKSPLYIRPFRPYIQSTCRSPCSCNGGVPMIRFAIYSSNALPFLSSPFFTLRCHHNTMTVQPDSFFRKGDCISMICRKAHLRFPYEKSSFSWYSKRIFHGILAQSPRCRMTGRKKNRAFRQLIEPEGKKKN